ncbi:hypothetical protein BIW11_07464 [Tropilaelaps mercedesae]|uniref:Uncharacterized protein n=1 Tax=Tropilaelaps mercedesae TaxID=418985 RepID=A0A1V9XTU4_9ACAR|nr:hypothetical protein BIW11_07464 [Tropilaelaps mercedesae]
MRCSTMANKRWLQKVPIVKTFLTLWIAYHPGQEDNSFQLVCVAFAFVAVVLTAGRFLLQRYRGVIVNWAKEWGNIQPVDYRPDIIDNYLYTMPR